jgi:hypothetical protein
MRPAPVPLRHNPFGGLAALALVLPLSAAAQMQAPSAAAYLSGQQRDGHEAVAEAPQLRAGDHSVGSARAGRGELPSLGTSRWSSARLIELPSDAAPGRYQRPHYALGFRSEALRGWLKDAGLEVQTCIAPMLRMRTKVSGQGELSGAVWVYARCALR